MTTEEYYQLWKQTIRVCELESNKDEATAFVHSYYDHNELFRNLDDKNLLVVFIGLVVYEERFNLKYGSTSPAVWCYKEIQNRINVGKYNKDLMYDVGEWAANYSKNPYVPMGTWRNLGPIEYDKFLAEYKDRLDAEITAKEERVKKRIEEGKKKVEKAKKKHKERIAILNELRNRPVNEAILYIEESIKPVFYYVELIEDWFEKNILTDEQKDKIISMFPTKSTRHNIRMRKKMIAYSQAL